VSGFRGKEINEAFLRDLPEPLASYVRKIEPAPDGGFHLHWRDFAIRSAFQPIVSFTHSSIVGHEALVRPVNQDGIPVPPPALFAIAQKHGESLLLDRACRALHFLNADTPPGWLFLNFQAVDFGTLATTNSSDSFLNAAVKHMNADLNRIIIEVVEDAVEDTELFDTAARRLRAHGIGLALDDFGAGASNFDRVWRIEPEIVKLDRSFTLQSDEDSRMRRMLPRIVELLHEAGAQVVLEGIETEEQALFAIDSNVDFGQGWFLGYPKPQCFRDPLAMQERINQLWEDSDRRSQAQDQLRQEMIAPIVALMEECALALTAGQNFAEIAERFLKLDSARRLYLLNHEGKLLDGPMVAQCDKHDQRSCKHCYTACLAVSKGRYNPLSESDSCLARARFSRQPFFRRALAFPHSVQITRPYISSCDGTMTTTASKVLTLNGSQAVLCGDLDWYHLNQRLQLRPDWSSAAL